MRSPWHTNDPRLGLQIEMRWREGSILTFVFLATDRKSRKYFLSNRHDGNEQFKESLVDNKGTGHSVVRENYESIYHQISVTWKWRLIKARASGGSSTGALTSWRHREDNCQNIDVGSDITGASLYSLQYPQPRGQLRSKSFCWPGRTLSLFL